MTDEQFEKWWNNGDPIGWAGTPFPTHKEVAKQSWQACAALAQSTSHGDMEDVAPCDYCVHKDVTFFDPPCIDCEKESPGKWTQYVPVFKIPSWGDVLHFLRRHNKFEAMRIVHEGINKIEKLETSVKELEAALSAGQQPVAAQPAGCGSGG